MEYGEIAKAVARNVRDLRTRRGLSRERLADLAGVHKNTIAGIESGDSNATIEKLEALAIALGVTAKQLLYSPAQETVESLGRFLRSDGGRRAKITPEEEARLAQLGIDYGAPSDRGWTLLLEGIRDAANDSM